MKSHKRGRTFAARVPDDLFDKITAEARLMNWTNGEMTRQMWLVYEHGAAGADRILAAEADAATEE